MISRRSLALGSALAAFALVPAGPALAAGPKVSVRIEGLHRTLLDATVTAPTSGSITKGGTPAGKCPAATAAGALNVATKGRWNGSYGSYGLSLTSVFDESHPLTSKDYWSIWADDRYASAGICGLALHAGEQLLFAAVPDKPNEYPIVISAPARAKAGKPFAVTLSYFNAKGRKLPLAGGTVRAADRNARSNAKGVAMITVKRGGKVGVSAFASDYIRSQVLDVTVAR